MRRGNLTAIATVLILATLLLATIPPGHARHGPREPDMSINFYDWQQQAYDALLTDKIDFLLHELTPAQAKDAFTNPNLVTCQVPGSNCYEFDLNNNYTITAYPGIRSPMNYSELRQAIAFLSNKDYYVDTLLGGFAVRIDQMITAPYYGWANESLSYPHYPYEYDPVAANATLNSKFPVGTTPNPYYDPIDPLSIPYLRHYPDDHPQKAGQDLDPLIFYVRSDYDAMLKAGRTVYPALRSMGVPVDVTECPHSGSYEPVFGDHNYHFYTGGWSVGRFPPMTLYGLYHSVNAFAYGSNYVTGAWFDDPAGPGAYQTHPQLDTYLYNTNYAASYSAAVTACKLAAGYMTEICVNVPLWSSAGYWAWCNKLLGIVNMQGDDPDNKYTFMNAFKTDSSPIRCGMVGAPQALNIVYSSWQQDFIVSDKMNLYGGLDTPAYNVAADQVGFVDYFETTTWMDGAEEKTLVIMSFREEGYCVRPVSGDQGENVNASHYFWNAWLDYQVGDGWWSPNFVDLHHVVITGPYDFEIYFDTLSYWNTYRCQGPLRPMDLWMAQGPTFINQTTETFLFGLSPDLETPGPIDLAHDPIWFDSVTFNGVPLIFMTDYNIVKGRLYLYTNLSLGTLVVTYRYVPPDALRGYTPGNLPWQTILEGAGMYYITSYASGVSATFKGNPFYYMVTPLLGEIDFVKKPSGNYKIDIFDVVLVAGAYGSQGLLYPSPNWFPGADLAPPVGIIDIFDLVTVTGNWDKEFDPLEP